MNHDEALKIADALVNEMRPYCDRIEIAGSLRRLKPEVRDIEIVAVPKWVDSTLGLFVTGEKLNRLLQWGFDYEATGGLQWIKPGTSEIVPWEPKRDGRYWRAMLPEGVKLDLFLARPENFGAIYLIRTGSAEFSQAVVTHALRIHKPCRDGFFTAGGEPVNTPDEEDVFRLLNLQFVEPQRRVDGSILKAR